jgi:hypothetical protein
MPARLIGEGRKVQRFLSIQAAGGVQKFEASFGPFSQGPKFKGPAHGGILGYPLEDFETVGRAFLGELVGLA